MEGFRSEIGSLATVFAFEAAARLGSFTLAADELNVSQAAVSKQIALLEERLGTTLFLRKHRHVVLTPEGQKLFAVSNTGLAAIASAMRDIRLSFHRPLTIVLSLALTRFWFMPLLPQFTRLHHEIPLRILSDDNVGPVPAMGIDLVVRYERVAVDEPGATCLFRASVRAMASPECLARHPVIDVRAVLTAPRVAYEAPGQGWISWDDWFRAAGIGNRATIPALSLTTYEDALIAAQQHQGIVLVWSIEGFKDSTPAGLVSVPGPEIAVPGGFYLTSRQPPSRESELLMAWLHNLAREG